VGTGPNESRSTGGGRHRRGGAPCPRRRRCTRRRGPPDDGSVPGSGPEGAVEVGSCVRATRLWTGAWHGTVGPAEGCRRACGRGRGRGRGRSRRRRPADDRQALPPFASTLARTPSAGRQYRAWHPTKPVANSPTRARAVDRSGWVPGTLPSPVGPRRRVDERRPSAPGTASPAPSGVVRLAQADPAEPRWPPGRARPRDRGGVDRPQPRERHTVPDTPCQAPMFPQRGPRTRPPYRARHRCSRRGARGRGRDSPAARTSVPGTLPSTSCTSSAGG
jgi:hypothetical protein